MDVRLIGDVHGKTDEYMKLVEFTDYSCQLGDMGFCYDHLDELDSARHRVLGGNHDNYAVLPQYKHYLGNYGIWQPPGTGLCLFFCRGAWSIDQNLRVENRDWWSAEQLDYRTAQCAIEYYKHVKPSIVITHDCPDELKHENLIMAFQRVVSTLTGRMLDAMFAEHRPNEWIFSHHHESRTFEYKGTKFRCLDELEYVDLSTERSQA